MADLFLGLISGTSADGIDVALMRFEPRTELVAARTVSYPSDLRERILALMHAESLPVDAFGALDIEIGECFARAALDLLNEVGIAPDSVRALGSHGQTVRHRPWSTPAFTLQIGDPNSIAEISGITTVADFRRRDMAAGGQGAPLVCALHAALFADPSESRAILNLGGIGNFTLLQPGRPVRGFDTGPANCLLDGWALRHLGRACDLGGDFAASGRVNADLLSQLLGDDYFARRLPKSTGREHFHLQWLDHHLSGHESLAPADVQATLLQLSARSIAQALQQHAPETARVLVCGGGVHNPILLQRLAAELEACLGRPCPVEITAEHGLDPDFVEAAAFAWLARQTLAGKPGNCAEVTGAAGPRVLGAVYFGCHG